MIRQALTLLLIVLFVSCHSTRQTARTEREVTNTTSAVRHDYAAHDWHQLWHALELQLDSFELWLPAACDTMECGTVDKSDICGPKSAAMAASRSTPATYRGVMLKAKRATLTTGTSAAHTAVQHEQHVDTFSLQRDIAADERQASDRVAVTKPPDIPWTTMSVIVAIGAAVGCCIWILRCKR